MSKKDFKKSADKPFELSDVEREKIDQALTRYLHMDAVDRAALINDIEVTGSFRQVGYGSLIGDPASETDKQYSGVVKGWEKGAFCKDRHYRGTPEKLGVTMGALPTIDGEGELPGVVMEISSDGDSSNFANRILRNIKEFALRETSLNPIYEYKVVDVDSKRHGRVKAIICAADPKNPLYLGRDGEENGLTIEEKAAIIATSKGVPGASPRNTGMAYWRDHIKCCELGGFKPDPKIEELVRLAELYRAELEITDPELFAELVVLEEPHSPAGASKDVTYATPVYDVPVISSSSRRVVDLRESAIVKASLEMDPLSSEKIHNIGVLKAELEHDLSLH